VGDATSGPGRLSFNPQLRVEFRGATVTSDAGLLPPRELDERLGLSALIEQHLTDPRTGQNRRFPLADLFRQSIYSRLAGYEDTNYAERLAEDPALRMLASRERRQTSVALTLTMHWFETDVLAEERNYQGLARLNTELVQRAATRTRRVILDIDSSESPVHGTQEHSAYNGHFESVCYHPLFVFNQEGDCLAATLRPGNVHSADGWGEVLLPVLSRYQARQQTVVVRADAAFALPALYEAPGRGLCHPAPGQSGAGAEDRRLAHPAPRPTQLRSTGAVSKLPVSDRVVGPASTGDCQGRASPGRALPPSGLYRHHAHGDEPRCRPVLQSARDGGAVDQGGQGSHPLDPALLSPVPGQRAAASSGMLGTSSSSWPKVT
jgi:DDE family transposase